MNTMNDRIEQIEARAEAATEGPWEVRGDHGEDPAVWHDREAAFSLSRCAECGVEAVYAPADAEFIAHAREDVPYLLALVQEQQARIDKVAKIAARMDRIADFNIAVMGQRDAMGISLRQHAENLRAALTATEDKQ